MMPPSKFLLLFVVSCLLLSMCSEGVEGQLPGIRWGRSYQHDDDVTREYKGNLWGLMKKRLSQYQLNDATQDMDSWSWEQQLPSKDEKRKMHKTLLSKHV